MVTSVQRFGGAVNLHLHSTPSFSTASSGASPMGRFASTPRRRPRTTTCVAWWHACGDGSSASGWWGRRSRKKTPIRSRANRRRSRASPGALTAAGSNSHQTRCTPYREWASHSRPRPP
jgi:hypothetical protein